MKPGAGISCLILMLPLLVVSPVRSQDDPPNLTGTWILNAKESDDLGSAMSEARGDGQNSGGGGGRRSGGGPGGGGGGPGGGGGQGGGGGPARGGGRGESGSGEDRAAQAEERMARQMEEYSRLEIYQDGIELNVANGLDISRLLFLDGREMTIWTQHGEATATASWRDQFLVVEETPAREGLGRTRSYTLSAGGQKLVMNETRRLPGQDKTIKLTMVYDLKR